MLSATESGQAGNSSSRYVGHDLELTVTTFDTGFKLGVQPRFEPPSGRDFTPTEKRPPASANAAGGPILCHRRQ